MLPPMSLFPCSFVLEFAARLYEGRLHSGEVAAAHAPCFFSHAQAINVCVMQF